MPKGRCLVLSSANIDEVLAVPHIVQQGETLHSTSFTKKAGGKGANTACAIARAGGSVSLAGHIGQDGLFLEDTLEQSGVDTTLLEVINDLPTGRAIIQVSPQDNCILLIQGANYAPHSALPSDLSSFTHLLCHNEIPLEQTVSALKKAKNAGLTTIYNPSPMLEKAQIKEFPFDLIDWLLVNEGEMSALQSNSAAGTFKKQNIVQTKGAKGLDLIISADSSIQLKQMPFGRNIPFESAKLLRPLKDTTGAGDTFAGYFVAQLLQDSESTLSEDELKRFIEVAQTASAICVEQEGAMESIPTLDIVQSRLSGTAQ